MRVNTEYREYEDDTRNEVTPARRPGDETRAAQFWHGAAPRGGDPPRIPLLLLGVLLISAAAAAGSHGGDVRPESMEPAAARDAP